MKIEDLLDAINSALVTLSKVWGTKTGHTPINIFQDDIFNHLKKNTNLSWSKEHVFTNQNVGDAIDIYGEGDGEKWIVELDAMRADQVAKKAISRIALTGLNVPIHYVIVLYPDSTGKHKNECLKYARFIYELLKKINPKSTVTCIFVNPISCEIEVADFDKQSRYGVTYNRTTQHSVGMTETANYAISEYCKSKNISYSSLVQIFGKYVNNQVGPSRYKLCEKVLTSDGQQVHSFTQWRKFGISAYWLDFVALCKKQKIKIQELRKIYDPSKKTFIYK